MSVDNALAWLSERQPQMEALLSALVEISSHTPNREGNDAVAVELVGAARALCGGELDGSLHLSPSGRFGQHVTLTSRAGKGAGAVLLGVPYDGGATIQAGARLAPYHVRRVSAFAQPYHLAHRLDVFAGLRAVDGGNLPTPPFDAVLARVVFTLSRTLGSVSSSQHAESSANR